MQDGNIKTLFRVQHYKNMMNLRKETLLLTLTKFQELSPCALHKQSFQDLPANNHNLNILNMKNPYKKQSINNLTTIYFINVMAVTNMQSPG